MLSNQDLRMVRERYARKFIISQFMDPRHPFARKKIRQYAANGARVIKLLPCLGYYPDDKKFDPFWKEMEKNKLVAMVHTGFITARHKQEERSNRTYLHSKYGNPLYFDILARKFPEMPVILCHTGGSTWYEEACQMISQHEHVWGDLSGPGSFALRRILQLNIVTDLNKLFWGNDSHPKYYYTNLNILGSTLLAAGKGFLQEALLYSNAHSFIRQYLQNGIA